MTISTPATRVRAPRDRGGSYLGSCIRRARRGTLILDVAALPDPPGASAGVQETSRIETHCEDLPTWAGPIARRDRRATRRAVVLVSLVAGLGCEKDDGLGRRPISGEATLDGKPLAAGSILFEPESHRVGTAVGTLIRGGKFSLARSAGPAPGRYVVRIYASSDVQSAPPPGLSEASARPMVELIPERYNSRSTLRAEVTPDSENTFRFTMRSEPPAPPTREGTAP